MKTRSPPRRDALTHAIGERLQTKAGAPRPVAERRAIKNDALAGINFSLPIKRQMIAKLRDDHLGDERLRRQAARHDMLGSVRLGDTVRTAAARVFGRGVTTIRPKWVGITSRRSETSSPIIVIGPQPHGHIVLRGLHPAAPRAADEQADVLVCCREIDRDDPICP